MRFIIPGATILISIVYLFLTYNLPQAHVGDPDAAQKYPLLIGYALLVLSVLYLISELKNEEKVREAFRIFSDKELTIKVIVVLALCLVYTFMFEPFGFLISTIIFLGALLFLINGAKKWLLNIIIALVFSFATWYAFAELLQVSLP